MRSAWGPVLRALCWTQLFTCVLLSGGDKVHTEAQAGPLYRVQGSELSISCSVSGLPPLVNNKNDFEFRIKRPANPDMEINIISTESGDFPYAVYSGRVKSGEIIVTYEDPNSVVLKVLRLEKTDEGEYECAVINTKGTYYGTYTAVTYVKVIDNSLSISSSAPASISQIEGGRLELTCDASSNTIQHTHLSFGWFLRTANSTRPIISLSRDFELIPGRGFEERYKAGHIRLDKIGQVTYRLQMSELKLSDEGALYCEVQEWIQDPDQTWFSIAQRAAEETKVTVKAKELLSDSAPLVVEAEIPQSDLQEGQRLSVSCSVQPLDPKHKFFSLAWLRGGEELARIGPTGVLTVGPDYSGREREGELRAARIGVKDYSLSLQPVRTSDQGEFVCRAWPEELSSTGEFKQGAAQDSQPHTVSISATESGLAVSMPDIVRVNEGDRLNLSCRASGVSGQLSVTWQHRSSPSAPFSSLASVSADGVLTTAPGRAEERLKALRPAPDLFTLELAQVTEAASGQYQCEVSEWTNTNSKGSSQVASSNVIVSALDSFASLLLIGRNHQAAEGEDVELICRVRKLKLPRTLTWSIRRSSTTPDNIVTLYSSGAMSWFGDQQRYQLKIDNKDQQNEIWYHLIISSVSKREAGNFQCSVSVDLQKVQRKLHSAELAVRVRSPVSDLTLASAPSIRGNINSDIQLKCSVSTNSLTLSRYAVTWFLQQPTGNKMLVVRSDQDALVTFGSDVDVTLRQRVSVSRSEGPEFVLNLHSSRPSDTGLYVCEVVQWRQDPSREWHQLPPVSKTTQLSVTELENLLLVETMGTELNVSTSQSFTVPCNISAQSSPHSQFQVTWFWRKDAHTGGARPLLTAYRNATFNYWSGQNEETLKFGHPLPHQYVVTMVAPAPADSGVYFCEVEEWVPSLSHEWRRVAVERSSNLTVFVLTEGAVSAAVCDSPTWIGVFSVVTLLLLLIILALALRICRGSGSAKNKEKSSYWTENHQLNPKDMSSL